MSYQLPPDINELVKQHIATGAYASEDEVLRDAMDALDQLEQERLSRWNERNQLAIEQSRQGLSKPLDGEKLLARVRERLAREGIVD